AVVERRHLGLVQDRYRPARLRETGVLGDIEDLGEPGILIPAQRSIDHMVGDDASLLGIVADAAQRPLAEGAGLLDAEMDAVGGHERDPYGSCETHSSTGVWSGIRSFEVAP